MTDLEAARLIHLSSDTFTIALSGIATALFPQTVALHCKNAQGIVNAITGTRARLNVSLNPTSIIPKYLLLESRFTVTADNYDGCSFASFEAFFAPFGKIELTRTRLRNQTRSRGFSCNMWDVFVHLLELRNLARARARTRFADCCLCRTSRFANTLFAIWADREKTKKNGSGKSRLSRARIMCFSRALVWLLAFKVCPRSGTSMEGRMAMIQKSTCVFIAINMNTLVTLIFYASF